MGAEKVKCLFGLLTEQTDVTMCEKAIFFSLHNKQVIKKRNFVFTCFVFDWCLMF